MPTRQKNRHLIQNGGFMQLIIIILMGVIILSLLGVNLSILFNNKTMNQNFKFINDFLLKVWRDYLVNYASYVWGVWIDYIWLPMYSFVESRFFNSRGA